MGEFEYECDTLAGNGCECRTTHSPLEYENKQWIEADDDEYGRQHDCHRLARIARSSQNLIHAEKQVCYGVAAEDYLHEIVGIGKSLVAGTEKSKYVVQKKTVRWL